MRVKLHQGIFFIIHTGGSRSVYDNTTSNVYNNGIEFKDGFKGTVEYKYDANGNLTKHH